MRPDQASKIILRPYVTEKTFDAIEGLNRLTFLVNNNSNKHSIKLAIKTLYDVEVETVNTSNTIQGKKAFVRLTQEYSAIDLASKLGVV
tara:strand:- start:913 stop:1179 length:267 start_codon:yes stop_codon:yes gene_type:complete